MTTKTPELMNFFKSAIGRLSGVGRPDARGFLGTCFLVAPRFVVTCHHVVKDCLASGEEMEVIFEGSLCRVVRVKALAAADSQADIALLEIAEETGLEPIPTSLDQSLGQSFFTYGYPREHGGAGVNLSGGIIGQSSTDLSARRLELDVDSRSIREGFSGAPVVVIESESVGYAVGCVSETTSESYPTRAGCTPFGPFVHDRPDLLEALGSPEDSGHFTSAPVQIGVAPDVGVFLDRQEQINRIRSFLEQDQRKLVIVQGLPGIGKSSLAAKMVGELRFGFKGVLWTECKADQTSLDTLMGDLRTLLEEAGDTTLSGIWRDPRPVMLDAKIRRLIRALAANPYLLVFDDFDNWLTPDLVMKNQQVRNLLVAIIRGTHRSKVILVSDRQPLFHPLIDGIPPGSILERTLPRLPNSWARHLLRNEGLRTKDRKLLSNIVTYCDGNPLMLRIFAHQVVKGYHDAKELLTSGGAGSEFDSLLETVIRDLTAESLRQLELLCILRQPLARSDFRELGMHFKSAVGPLLGRFLAMEDPNTLRVEVPSLVRTIVLRRMPEQRRRDLHKEAADLYLRRRGGRDVASYPEALGILEEAYHLAEASDYEGAARAVISVSSHLIDWGYPELAEQNLLRVIEKSTDRLVQAGGQWDLGAIYDLRGRPEQALHYFRQALDLYRSLGDHTGVARTQFRIGRIHNALGEFELADSNFESCIRTCEEHGVTAGRAASLVSMGWNIRIRFPSETNRALELYREGLRLADQRDAETLCTAHRQIGFLLAEGLGEREDALWHYGEAVRIGKKHNLAKESTAVQIDLGYLYAEWGDYPRAESCCHRAIEACEVLGDDYGLANARYNLGRVLEALGRPGEAMEQYELSQQLYIDVGNPFGQSSASLRIGELQTAHNNSS
jgi:tetratricopeptide (TPR) repeat protein